MKFIDGFTGLANFIQGAMVNTPFHVDMAVSMAARVIAKEVRKVYGQKSKLAHLSDETTIPERVELGFTPDKPLLRDGHLLRDSITIKRLGIEEAIIGSTEEIAVYHEYGYWSDLYQSPVPARPVMKIAAAQAEEKVAALVDAVLGSIFTGEFGMVISDPEITEAGVAAIGVSTDFAGNFNDGEAGWISSETDWK